MRIDEIASFLRKGGLNVDIDEQGPLLIATKEGTRIEIMHIGGGMSYLYYNALFVRYDKVIREGSYLKFQDEVKGGEFEAILDLELL